MTPDISVNARVDALRRSGLLDSPPEEAFDRLARLASRLVRAPVVLVSLVDENRQFFKSHVGLCEPWASARETPLTHSFCQYVVGSRAPLVIEDARSHPLVAQNRAIPDLGVVAYAGMPLVTSGGATLGSFCAIDTEPRAWTPEELSTLEDLAASVATEIELRLAAAQAGQHARKLAGLLESTGEGIYGIDPEGRCTFVNRTAARLLGYDTADELVGRNMHALCHHSRPDGSPYPQEDCPIMRASWVREGCRVDDEVLWRRDGTSFPAEYSSFPVVEDGVFSGAVVTFSDITERKVIEARLEAAYQHEKRIAQTFQETLLPTIPRDRFAGLIVETRYQAAWSEAQVGGDFYDAFALPARGGSGSGGGRVALLVGDVSGKGLKAATRTAEVRHILRTLLHVYDDPADAVARLNDILSVGYAAESDTEISSTFVVLSLAVVDAASGEAVFVVAGGEPPIVLRGDGRAAETVQESGFLLGIGAGQAYPSVRVTLAPGDALLMVTDGLTEARRGNDFLGCDGLLDIVARATAAGAADAPDELVRTIVAGARSFANDSLHDDVCLLLARRRPGAA